MESKISNKECDKVVSGTITHNDSDILKDPSIARLQDIWNNYSQSIDCALSDTKSLYDNLNLPDIEPFTFRFRHFAAVVALVIITIFTVTPLKSQNYHYKVLKNNNINIEKTIKNIQWTIEAIP